MIKTPFHTFPAQVQGREAGTLVYAGAIGSTVARTLASLAPGLSQHVVKHVE